MKIETNHHFNIAIDGPAGAGKSTIAKAVARKLGFIYVDTGAMYRAMALYFLQNQIPVEDQERISQVCKDIDIVIRYENNSQEVYLNGENVTGLIRTEAVGKAASSASVYPAVRAHLLELQRSLAAEHNVIMDGRDIGTCILPDADVKIFLTASSHIRAVRRYKELTEKGIMCNLQEIEQDIRERDERDSTRAAAPLAKADDAVLVDATDMTAMEVMEMIIRIAKERGLVVEV